MEIMKLLRMKAAPLCMLALAALFTACDDNEDDWSWENEGSQIELARTRGFVLNEGSYGENNAHLSCFNYATDQMYGSTTTDIYEIQNGRKIGDTGQDVIAYNGNLYMVVYNSNYVVKLNGVGKEEARISFADKADLGQVRNLTAGSGYIYVTSYGGYVSRLDANTLEYKGSVQVGQNPEQVTVLDGKVYCVNSGWGYDNRLSIIDEKSFDTAEQVEIMTNPQSVIATGGKIVICGYGSADYTQYTNPVQVYDPKTGECTEVGHGTNIAGRGNTVYIVNTTTDYSTQPYTGTTTVSSYDLKTGATNDNVLKNVPDEMKNACAYGISVSDLTGDIYVCITNYVWGDGTVYHFDSNGNYVGKFTSGGQNPKKLVFLN